MVDQEVTIKVDNVELIGNINLPEDTNSLVIFSHGSGSSRLSPRNTYVADYLNKLGFGTLLFDLLTPREDEMYENRFDLELITGRLVFATNFIISSNRLIAGLNIGYFGASTGAAAALVAAIELRDRIKAVVSRGGRPDLVIELLPKVTAPTLFIVGGDDDVVLGLNQQAYENMKYTKKIVVIPGAGHLFEEPGALESVAINAGSWFKKYLV